MNAALVVKKVGVSVQMVKILQERKIQLVFDVFVLFALGEDGREVDGELLVADGVFEHTLVARL